MSEDSCLHWVVSTVPDAEVSRSARQMTSWWLWLHSGGVFERTSRVTEVASTSICAGSTCASTYWISSFL